MRGCKLIASGVLFIVSSTSDSIKSWDMIGKGAAVVWLTGIVVKGMLDVGELELVG